MARESGVRRCRVRGIGNGAARDRTDGRDARYCDRDAGVSISSAVCGRSAGACSIGRGRCGPERPVFVSETVWRSLYGAEPGFVGRTITVNGERLVVVGVLPAEFRFPSAETVLWRPTDLASRPGERARAYVRFASGMPRDEALRLATDAARAADPANASLRPWVYTLAGMDDEYSKRAVPLLAGGVGLVFLVLCANVCGLLLARLTARRREFSMRAALGASRGRLIARPSWKVACSGPSVSYWGRHWRGRSSRSHGRCCRSRCCSGR